MVGGGLWGWDAVRGKERKGIVEDMGVGFGVGIAKCRHWAWQTTSTSSFPFLHEMGFFRREKDP